MITIKNKLAIQKMQTAGSHIAEIFELLKTIVVEGKTSLEIDSFIASQLQKRGLVSATKGYKGYKHVCCVSIDDEVVHGVPGKRIIKNGDLVKVDICASFKGYCADAARTYAVGAVPEKVYSLINAAQLALDKGIMNARAGNRLTDISAAIQHEVEFHGFGVIRDFAGHGIGKSMHEDPEILNYGKSGKGPIIRAGMTFAIEPMITEGDYEVFVEEDGWTVRTKDKSMAAHVEDTVLVTDNEPLILTRLNPN